MRICGHAKAMQMKYLLLASWLFLVPPAHAGCIEMIGGFFKALQRWEYELAAKSDDASLWFSDADRRHARQWLQANPKPNSQTAYGSDPSASNQHGDMAAGTHHGDSHGNAPHGDIGALGGIGGLGSNGVGGSAGNSMGGGYGGYGGNGAGGGGGGAPGGP